MPALEVLVVNGRIQQAIIDPLLTGDIEGIVADGAYYGMVTFDQSLATLLADGTSTWPSMATATNPHDLKVMLERQGSCRPGRSPPNWADRLESRRGVRYRPEGLRALMTLLEPGLFRPCADGEAHRAQGGATPSDRPSTVRCALAMKCTDVPPRTGEDAE